MYAKAVTNAGRLQQTVPVTYICNRLGYTHAHSLAFSQTDVITPFLLHICKQAMLFRCEIHHDSTSWLNRLYRLKVHCIHIASNIIARLPARLVCWLHLQSKRTLSA